VFFKGRDPYFVVEGATALRKRPINAIGFPNDEGVVIEKISASPQGVLYVAYR
jgi:hypothetical protein